MSLLSGLFKWGHHPRYVEGLLHASRGEFEAAAGCFDAVLADVRDPADPERGLALVHAAQAHARLGLACFHAGNYARAEVEFTHALRGHPGFPDLRYLRARIYERSGRLAEAVADLARALDDHPGSLEAHLLLAVCLHQLDRGEDSEAALERALTLGFDLPAGLSAVRIAEWGVADWRQLVPALHREAQVGGRGGVQEAIERHQAGDLAGATAALERAVRERPAHADLRCRLASLMLEAGRLDECLEQLEAALAINPCYLEARLLAVRGYLEQGTPRAAIAHAMSMVNDHADYPDLHFWLGLARFRAGDLAGAADALERAVALNRGFARAQRLLGLIYHALGRPGEALQALSRGLTRDRELPQTALETPLPPPAVGETAGAEGELVRALAIQPDYPDLHLALARTRRLRGDLDGAATAYRAALTLAPDYAAAALELAGVEIALGRVEEAETLLVALADRHPGWADVQALLGRTRLLRGDPEGAESALRAALRINPAYAAARADLGWSLLAQSRPGDADAEFARALELDPTHALPRQQLAWRDLLSPGVRGAA